MPLPETFHLQVRGTTQQWRPISDLVLMMSSYSVLRFPPEFYEPLFFKFSSKASRKSISGCFMRRRSKVLHMKGRMGPRLRPSNGPASSSSLEQTTQLFQEASGPSRCMLEVVRRQNQWTLQLQEVTLHLLPAALLTQL